MPLIVSTRMSSKLSTSLSSSRFNPTESDASVSGSLPTLESKDAEEYRRDGLTNDNESQPSITQSIESTVVQSLVSKSEQPNNTSQSQDQTLLLNDVLVDKASKEFQRVPSTHNITNDPIFKRFESPIVANPHNLKESIAQIALRTLSDNLGSYGPVTKQTESDKARRGDKGKLVDESNARRLWFDFLDQLNYELGWLILKRVIQDQVFSNPSIGDLGSTVPFITDSYFYFPNFVLAKRPCYNVVEQSMFRKSNPLQPLGSVLSLASEITQSTYDYLRQDLVAEQPFFNMGFQQQLDGNYEGLNKSIVGFFGPTRLFHGKMFKPGDVRLSTSLISQLLTPSGEKPVSAPQKVYIVSASYISSYATLVVTIDRQSLTFDRLEVCVAFQCTQYRLGADGSLLEPKVLSYNAMINRPFLHSVYVNFPKHDSVPRIFSVDQLPTAPRDSNSLSSSK